MAMGAVLERGCNRVALAASTAPSSRPRFLPFSPVLPYSGYRKSLYGRRIAKLVVSSSVIVGRESSGSFRVPLCRKSNLGPIAALTIAVDGALRNIGKLLGGNGKRARITRSTSEDRHNPSEAQENTPLWLWTWISVYRTVKDALSFVWEQPGQLQHIEWPSLQSTVKMAILTVVVVASLIVFLTTVDSSFSFLLSSVLRRVP